MENRNKEDLTVNELLASLEENYDPYTSNNSTYANNNEVAITLLPPITACKDSTDEDVSINHFREASLLEPSPKSIIMIYRSLLYNSVAKNITELGTS
ncbi:hypothetical protein JTB14_014343 [Gonioctena quinquepunctata]|nr:hypothetical protein JTB14_014343 [Gonioctena quinquepunctata]